MRLRQNVRHGLAILAAALVMVGGAGAPGSAAFAADRTDLVALETRAVALGMQMDAAGAFLSGLSSGAASDGIAIEAPAVVARTAQSAEAGALAVRLSSLEEQFRLLTGQVEGLTFQLAQLQTVIERLSQDIDFRFNALAGGGAAATPAPAAGAPARTTTGEASLALPVAPVGAGAPILPALPTVTSGTPLPPIDLAQPGAAADPQVPSTLVASLPEGVLLGAPDTPLGTLSQADLDAIAGGQPLDLGLPPSFTGSPGDAVAQFEAGLAAAREGDFAFAEDQLAQFLASYPEHERAPDAINILGASLLQRGAYDEAADILVNGFRKYPDAASAPDILLSLGVALAGAGEREAACRTFVEVERRYATRSETFATRLESERARAIC